MKSTPPHVGTISGVWGGEEQDFYEVGESSPKNTGEVARKAQGQAGILSAGRREAVLRHPSRRGRQQQLYNRWDEHAWSCSARILMRANPGRLRFGGCGPERIRFGGEAPEFFTVAFAHEGRTLKGNEAQGSIEPTVD